MVKKFAKINDQCINCGMCCDVCPCKAIREGGECWFDGDVENKPESEEHYYVIKKKCIGCGRCKNVCPISNVELEVEQ